MSFRVRGLFGRDASKPPSSGASDSDRRSGAQQLVDRGNAAEAAGALGQALQLYRDAIAADPEFAQAHISLGIALQSCGEMAAAVASYRRVASLDPGSATAKYNLGLSLHLAGDHSQAEAALREALRLRAEFPEALVTLAAALEALGREDEALAALDSAVEQRKDYAGALLSAGRILKKMGRLDAAESRLRCVPREHPEHFDALIARAGVLSDQGRLDAAKAEYRRALEINPDHVEVQNNLGIVLGKQGNLDEAIVHFRRALHLMPDFGPAQTNLLSALQFKGETELTIQLLFRVLAAQPANAHMRRALAEALDGVTLGPIDERARHTLLSLCRDDSISMRNLGTVLVGLLRNCDAYPLLLRAIASGSDPFAMNAPALREFLRDPLFLAALPRMTINDAQLETVLTHLRRWMLFRLTDTDGSAHDDPEIPIEFTCTLARHCFYSEYAFFQQEDERRHVGIIRRSIETQLRGPVTSPQSLESSLAVVALYGSLHSIQGCERLLGQPATVWSVAFAPIVQEQIANRRREREIAEQLVAITTVEDRVSIAVRDQYEQNPYPHWVSVQHAKPETIEELSLRLGADDDPRIRPRPVPVLIAGCGTGHHPVQVALAYPDAEILAIDLSRASLAYAARMTERFAISNITYRQADILKLGDIGRRFSLIDASGVLHHMREPIAGWEILVDLLEPDGLMRIALYSRLARDGIHAAREFARTLDLPPSAEGIRRCRRAVIELPDGHPARDASTYADFFTLSGCRDLIMHVEEHTFTLPEIAECLNQLGLRFLDLECNSPTRARFQELFPGEGAQPDLEAWHRFEQACPQAFKGMYQFWCCRASS